ncbi:ferric reductase like transmembrane component-domain-containing protein [Roridomyces roridus]|uniref:Ferric reductase like transmembrane component-domain-containing protein n=1 Tax=Roridomyces roridus TaxID=1738132 RepID=A0AAD7BHU3_9AGAR|nr:ferric reductase like transmembrane component-domain-containing protein [Roridomyces roridus]
MPFFPRAEAPQARAATSKLDLDALVSQTVLCLVVLGALAFLLRIPRVLARFWHRSEWTKGHRLGYTDTVGPSHATTISFNAATSSPSGYLKEAGSSQESHSSYEDPKFAAMTRPQRDPNRPLPPHISPNPSFLRPVVSVLRSPVAPGVSYMQVFICLGYLGVLLYPSIYRSRGPFVDIKRYGYISVAQIPFIFALSTKNNVIGTLLGYGYEKLNFLHRFVARIAIVAANLHGFGYFYKWCLLKTFQEEIQDKHNFNGLFMLICLDGLLLTSLPFVRKNAYNVFFYSHIVFSIGAVARARLFPTTPRWDSIWPLLPRFSVLITFSVSSKHGRLSRLVRPIPELGLTRVEIPTINKGWRAGQHVRVRILSSAMGITGWAEVHPFTIASEPGNPEGLVLMCKKSGHVDAETFRSGVYESGRARYWGGIQGLVERPYGGPGFAVFNSFTAAVFVCGGSGITFALSAAQELIQSDLRGDSRVSVIELVWVVQDPSSLLPLIPQFTAMIQQCRYTRLFISVHYTKALVGNSKVPGVLPPGLTLSPGRPQLISLLESTVSLAVNTMGRDESASGMIVGVCGPVGLGDDVTKSVGLIDPEKRDLIGGIEMHEETFGW